MTRTAYATIRRRVAAHGPNLVDHLRHLEHHYNSLGIPYGTHQLCHQGKFYTTWP